MMKISKKNLLALAALVVAGIALVYVLHLLRLPPREFIYQVF